MTMTHGALIARLRENFSVRLENEADIDALSEHILMRFDQACVRTLIEAYEGGQPAPNVLTPQQRGARTRKANQQKREREQTKAALGHVTDGNATNATVGSDT